GLGGGELARECFGLGSRRFGGGVGLGQRLPGGVARAQRGLQRAVRRRGARAQGVDLALGGVARAGPLAGLLAAARFLAACLGARLLLGLAGVGARLGLGPGPRLRIGGLGRARRWWRRRRRW